MVAPAAIAAAASQSWKRKRTSVGVMHDLILDSGKSQLDAGAAVDCRRTAGKRMCDLKRKSRNLVQMQFMVVPYFMSHL